MTGRPDMLFNITPITPLYIVLPNGSETYACHEDSIIVSLPYC